MPALACDAEFPIRAHGLQWADDSFSSVFSSARLPLNFGWPSAPSSATLPSRLAKHSSEAQAVIAASVGQSSGPGIIAVDPIRIGLVAKPSVGSGAELDLRGAGLARRLETAKGVRHSRPINAIEAA